MFQTSPAPLFAELTLAYQSLQAIDVVCALDSVCGTLGLGVSDYSEAYQVLEIERGGHLNLSGKKLTVSGGSIGRYRHDFVGLNTSGVEFATVVAVVSSLVRELEASQAFLHDREYFFWQNADSLLEYETKGRSHAHLPKKSNGFPPPLEQTIIDTSNNPGRRILRDGYRECVSSPMWIHSSLIKNRGALNQTDGVVLDEEGHLVRISSSSEPFSSDQGEQGTVQESIRRAVFET